MYPAPLYSRVDAPLVSALSRYVAVSCPAALAAQREDIVQNVLVRLHRISGTRTLCLSSAYLKRAARSGVCDAWRRRAARPEASEVEAYSQVPGPDTRLAHRRMLDAAGIALAALPDDRRRAVTLYLEGFRIVEIASELKCDRKRADNLVYRGLAALRRDMAERGYGSAELLS